MWCQNEKCTFTTTVLPWRPDCGSKMLKWHLLPVYFLVYHHVCLTVNVNIFVTFSHTNKKNIYIYIYIKSNGTLKTFFSVHLTLSLLPTHDRLPWPPPVPSRHQLIYQNTWTDLLVCLQGLSNAPHCFAFWQTRKGKLQSNTYKALKPFQDTAVVSSSFFFKPQLKHIPCMCNNMFFV